MKQIVFTGIEVHKLSYTSTTPLSQPTVDTTHQCLFPTLIICARVDLKCKNFLQCRRLQACHVGKILKHEHLSSRNDIVIEPPSTRRNHLPVVVYAWFFTHILCSVSSASEAEDTTMLSEHKVKLQSQCSAIAG